MHWYSLIRPSSHDDPYPMKPAIKYVTSFYGNSNCIFSNRQIAIPQRDTPQLQSMATDCETSLLSSASDSSECVYNYNYVTEPDDELKCLICLDVARDPLQHEECGKLFCRECLEKHGKKKPCPNCKTKDSKYYQDKKSEHSLAK